MSNLFSSPGSRFSTVERCRMALKRRSIALDSSSNMASFPSLPAALPAVAGICAWLHWTVGRGSFGHIRHACSATTSQGTPGLAISWPWTQDCWQGQFHRSRSRLDVPTAVSSDRTPCARNVPGHRLPRENPMNTWALYAPSSNSNPLIADGAVFADLSSRLKSHGRPKCIALFANTQPHPQGNWRKPLLPLSK